jgi:hypothetical protein
MYKIIGADQKEYGPITAEQLRQWIAEGRANAQTMIQAEGQTDWRPLSSFPEFAAILPAAGAAPAYGRPVTAGPAVGGAQPPPNYLVQSILVTVCCCLPFGIPAIVFAGQVNSKMAAGDYEGAAQASKKAKMWCWIALASGLVAGVIGIIIQIAAGAMAGFQR